MEKDAIEFNLTERISHLIMMNSFFIVDPGLYHGQMGIAVAINYINIRRIRSFWIFPMIFWILCLPK